MVKCMLFQLFPIGGLLGGIFTFQATKSLFFGYSLLEETQVLR